MLLTAAQGAFLYHFEKGWWFSNVDDLVERLLFRCLSDPHRYARSLSAAEADWIRGVSITPVEMVQRAVSVATLYLDPPTRTWIHAVGRREQRKYDECGAGVRSKRRGGGWCRR